MSDRGWLSNYVVGGVPGPARTLPTGTAPKPGIPAELLGPPPAHPDSPVATLGLPSRSEIEGSIQDIEAMEAAAKTLRAKATRLRAATATHVAQIVAPAATEWDGEARDAARDEADDDQVAGNRAANHADDMAALMERTAGSMRYHRTTASEATEDAEQDNFKVHDDLRVTDTRTYNVGQARERNARQAIADQHERYIIAPARALAGEAAETKTKLQAGAAKYHDMIPANWKTNRTMQAAGYPRPANGPTTPTTTEHPRCDPQEQAKLIKKFAEWCAERDRLTKEISEYDATYPPGHWFNKNDPYELAEYERGQELQRERGKLVHDYGELLKDATTCGAKQDPETGDILWPDGTRTTLRPPK